MHAVAAFFASIIAFVSGFLAPPLASDSPTAIQATQPAAAAVSQTEIAGNPFNDPAAAASVAAAIPTTPSPAFPPPPQTIINQPVIERIIERVVPQGDPRISADTLTAILTDFGQSIEDRIATINPPKADIPQQVAAAGNSSSYYFAPASQRIDQLTNTAINTPTITDGGYQSLQRAAHQRQCVPDSSSRYRRLIVRQRMEPTAAHSLSTTMNAVSSQLPSHTLGERHYLCAMKLRHIFDKRQAPARDVHNVPAARECAS